MQAILLLMTLLLADTDTPPPRVAVVMSESREEYGLAMKGLKESLKIPVDEYDFRNDPERTAAVFKAIERSKPDLVIAFGSSAYETVKLNVQDLPVMFSMVADLEQYRVTGEIPFGVSLRTDPLVEMQYVKELVGPGRRIGLIYDPKLSGKLVEHLKVAAAAQGLSLDALPAKAEKDACNAIEELKDRVDLFFLIPDPVTAGAVVFDKLRLECARRSKPIIGFSRKQLAKDVLAVLSSDYHAIGLLTGEIALEFLNQGTGKAIHYPRKAVICINVKVAERLKIKIPKGIRKEAVIVE
jgi:putative ABC transport system substrate-binding protein